MVQRINLTLTQLQYVVAVARHRSFSAAAESCHVTQPTLSMQVQKLEEELNLVVFDRSQVPVRVTAAGQRLIDQAEQALEEAFKIYQVAGATSQAVEGEVRIGIIPTLAPYLLPPTSQYIIKHHPAIDLRVEELHTDACLSRLREHSLDIAILAIPLHEDSIREIPLFLEPFWIYAHHEHRLAEGRSVAESELTTQDLWLLADGHCFRNQVMRLCPSQSLRDRRAGRGSGDRGTIQKPVEFEAGTLETLRRMVDLNGGYTLLPELAVTDLGPARRQRQVRPFKAPVPVREIGLVTLPSFGRESLLTAIQNAVLSALPDSMLKATGDLQKKKKLHKLDVL